MASSVNGHDGKYQRAAHGQPRHSALTDGDGAAAYALPWSDDDLRRGLTAEECDELAAHETVIERGLQTFYEVGTALVAIRDKRLYRAAHTTFEDYCRERWQMSRQRALQFIDASEVVANLTTIVVTPPANEAQARPLVALEPDAQRVVWEVVQQTAPAGKVTAAHVKSVVNVFKEVVTTGAIDDGSGEQVRVADVVKAAVTEETYERMQRQQAYIHEKTARRLALEERRQEKARTAQSLPSGIYNVIYADPPWQYDNTGVDAAANAHYHTLPLADICDFLKTINLQVAQNAVLFLWSTNPFLADALRVVEAWNFTYKTNLVWVKTDLSRPGTGFYVRGQHELLFICTRGSFTPLNWSQNVPSVLAAPVRQHSRKPDEIYGVIENLYPNCRYIELFARQQRDGWTAYGNELN